MRLINYAASWRKTLSDSLILVFVGASLMLGGAGRNHPLLETVLQLLALAVLFRVMVAPNRPLLQGALRGLVLVAAAAAGWFALQMLPLPPSLWQTLPERAIPAQIDAAIGWSVWRPFSLTPDVTGAYILALLPPLAGVMGGVLLRDDERKRLLALIAALALAMALLGILQLASGGESLLLPFKTTHDKFGIGLFVNRNHQACFLLMAMPLTLTIARSARDAVWRWAGFATLVMLALGVVATASRTGLFLLPIVGCSLLYQVGTPYNRTGLRAALLAMVGFAALVWFTPAFQLVLARFSIVADDSRLDYWNNTLYLLGKIFPSGGGGGSYRQIYAASEPLAQVQVEYVEHAHNDYLEWLLEMGWPGIVVMLALLIVVVVGFRQMVMHHAGDRNRVAMAQAGLIGLLVLMACSVTDFPLRMPALAVLGGVMLALIMPASFQPPRPRARISVALAAGMGLLLAVPVILVGGAKYALYNNKSGLSVRLAPWIASAWSSYATQRQLAGDSLQAQAFALHALRIEPMDAEAISNLAIARLRAGNTAGAAAVMLAGAQLGWRDPIVQAWLVDQGIAQEQYDITAHGLNALLRIHAPSDRPFAMLNMLLQKPGGRAALVETLAERPGWRAGFLNYLAKDVSEEFDAIEVLLIDLARAGAPVNEDETALMRWSAADKGDFRKVARLWKLGGGQGLVGHPEFNMRGGPLPPVAAPMVWRAPPLPGVSINLDQLSGAQLANGVTIASDGVASGVVLAQTLALPQGRYRVTLRMNQWDGPDNAHLSLRLTCRGGEALALPLLWRDEGDKAQTGQSYFSVDSQCDGQDLALVLSSSQGQHLAYSVKFLRVDTVADRGASAH